MANYLYNGVELPVLPSLSDGLTYLVVVDYTGVSDSEFDYLLQASNQPFVELSGDYEGCYGYQVDTGSSYKYSQYTCSASDIEWYLAYQDDVTETTTLITWPGITDETPALWANTDILNKDGTTYFAASVLVRVFDQDSFLMGMSCGLLVQGWLNLTAKTPITYSYNGVQLPALPVVEGYPYMMIAPWILGNTSVFEAYLLKEVTYTNWESGNLSGVGVAYSPDTALRYKWTEESGVWAEYEITDSNGVCDYFILWANFDVLNKDGTIYLAASEPTPVYE